MSKGVQKYCSILNYIRQADEDLFELVQDLCVGHMFKPRKNTPGVTFLRPSKLLLGKIKKLAHGENPEQAVPVIQSLILSDFLPSLSSFDERKQDIPTLLRKKLPVASVNSKQVLLKNGAVITNDPNFKARADRSQNMMVYNIDVELVPTDGEASAGAKPMKPKVKGGFETKKQTRAKVFEAVLKQMCSCDRTKRNPAVELLVQMLINSEEDHAVHDAILAQLSNDALASLACVLQPYRDEPTYLSDDAWASLSDACSFPDQNAFCYAENIATKYRGYLSEGASKFKSLADAINKEQDGLSDGISKFTVVNTVKKFYDEHVSKVAEVKPGLTNVLAFAEAELRVFSALIQDNDEHTNLNYQELHSLFSNKCTLNKPYMCDSSDQINMSNVGFYYSTILALARSDALLSLPNIGESRPGLEALLEEDKLIQLMGNDNFGSDSHYNEVHSKLQRMMGKR